MTRHDLPLPCEVCLAIIERTGTNLWNGLFRPELRPFSH
jgi:hypothetical protein